MEAVLLIHIQVPGIPHLRHAPAVEGDHQTRLIVFLHIGILVVDDAGQVPVGSILPVHGDTVAGIIVHALHHGILVAHVPHQSGGRDLQAGNLILRQIAGISPLGKILVRVHIRRGLIIHIINRRTHIPEKFLVRHEDRGLCGRCVLLLRILLFFFYVLLRLFPEIRVGGAHGGCRQRGAQNHDPDAFRTIVFPFYSQLPTPPLNILDFSD